MATLKTSLMSGKLKRLNKSLLTVLIWLFYCVSVTNIFQSQWLLLLLLLQIHSLLLPAVIFVGCDSAP